jgi:hypothetical protein
MSNPRKLARWLWRRWAPWRPPAPHWQFQAVGALGEVGPKGPPPGKDLSWLDTLNARPERPSIEG